MEPFDAEGNFQYDPEALGDLLHLAAGGAAVAVVSEVTGLAAQILATVTLSRILAPGDFGLVAMVTTFSLLLTNCGMNGFTEAILQRDKINRALVTNLFWINFAVGLFLAVGFAAAGSLLAWFFGDHRVVNVTIALSSTILITCASVEHLALLKRAMHFSKVSANGVIARIVSVVVAIILGLAGWGYWALVAGIIALTLSTSLGAWIMCPWVPGRPRRSDGTASMVRFSVATYARFVLNYSARNTDNILIGWKFGPAALGFYKKAYDLFALSTAQLVSPITDVATSALSRLVPDSKQYKSNFVSALSVTAFIGMGLSACLTLTGRDVIRLLLGAKWATAGVIFTFFAPGIGAMLLYYTHGWIHVSIGRADRWFRWTLVELGVTIALFLAAIPWGPVGFAVAWAASFWILTIPSLWYAGKPIDFEVSPMLAAIWKFVLASLVAGFVCAAILGRTQMLATASTSLEAVFRICEISLLFLVLYIGAVILFHRGLEPLRQLGRLGRAALRPRHT